MNGIGKRGVRRSGKRWRAQLFMQCSEQLLGDEFEI